ncbi:MAG: hypothetical protein VB066_03405, partial [Paludibacter sp.]|nr:hypothetical protein [Paludibacter sp.]
KQCSVINLVSDSKDEFSTPNVVCQQTPQHLFVKCLLCTIYLICTSQQKARGLCLNSRRPLIQKPAGFHRKDGGLLTQSPPPF